MGLIIRSSTIHAAGCYTTAPIAQGTRVVEYTGPLIDKDQADLLYQDRPITYLFGVGDGTRVIDGHGTAMFINHSCDANCETEEIDDHVWIMAIRDITAGEELCYDYCLYDGDGEEAPCNCGAKSCRGSMFSPEELQRRKRKGQTKTVKPLSKPLKKQQPKSSRAVKTKKKTASQETSRKLAADKKKQVGRKPSGKSAEKSPKELRA